MKSIKEIVNSLELKIDDKVEIPDMYSEGEIIKITDDYITIFWSIEKNATPTGDDLEENYYLSDMKFLLEGGFRKI